MCFHITGFGAFGTGDQRVVLNPSELVVHSLQRGALPAPLPAHARIASACVLPVAGRAAAAAVDTLPEVLSTGGADTEAATLRLHLGVNTGSTCYHLERCAWNQATFKQADEAGWSPGEHQPVCSAVPLGACYKTAVPCDALAAVLRAQGFAVYVSDDPGRCAAGAAPLTVPSQLGPVPSHLSGPLTRTLVCAYSGSCAITRTSLACMPLHAEGSQGSNHGMPYFCICRRWRSSLMMNSCASCAAC